MSSVRRGRAGAAQFLDSKMSEPTPRRRGTGSCWEVVDNWCRRCLRLDHGFLAVGEVADPDECSMDATAYVELNSSYLCLADD